MKDNKQKKCIISFSLSSLTTELLQSSNACGGEISSRRERAADVIAYVAPLVTTDRLGIGPKWDWPAGLSRDQLELLVRPMTKSETSLCANTNESETTENISSPTTLLGILRFHIWNSRCSKMFPSGHFCLSRHTWPDISGGQTCVGCSEQLAGV